METLELFQKTSNSRTELFQFSLSLISTSELRRLRSPSSGDTTTRATYRIEELDVLFHLRDVSRPANAGPRRSQARKLLLTSTSTYRASPARPALLLASFGLYRTSEDVDGRRAARFEGIGCWVVPPPCSCISKPSSGRFGCSAAKLEFSQVLECNTSFDLPFVCRVCEFC